MSGRKLVTAATLTLLLVVVLGMAAYGYHALTAPLPNPTATASPTCSAAETTVKRFITRPEVTVSVYNAGAQGGRAGATMASLEGRGFVAGEVGNAPRSVHVKRAVVWTTKTGDAGAKLVAAALGRHTKVVVSRHALGPGVDVFIGPRFHRLNPKAPQRMRLAAPISSCTRVS